MSKQADNISIGKMRRLLFLLSFFKIPIIGFVRPRLITLNDKEAVVRIRLRRRTKNHLKSMYFGALAVGADVAAGLHAFYFSRKMGRNVSFAFKSMSAEFLMRAESHTTFTSNQGHLVEKAMKESLETQTRINQEIEVLALNAKKEIVAKFVMVISVRVK